MASRSKIGLPAGRPRRAGTSTPRFNDSRPRSAPSSNQEYLHEYLDDGVKKSPATDDHRLVAGLLGRHERSSVNSELPASIFLLRPLIV
jgi:hypothetical protein